jgi:hypothetical protein
MAIELEKMIIVILVMTIFITGVSLFTGDLYNNYPNVQNVTYITQSGELADQISGMQGEIEAAGDAGVEVNMVTGAWRVLVLLFRSMNVFEALIGNTLTLLHLPSEFALLFVGIITVIVIFGLVYLIMSMRR